MKALNRLRSLLLPALCFAYCCKAPHLLERPGKAEQQFAAEGFQLVWSDEFNDKGTPDNANWSFEQGFVRNQEHQWYQPQNAWCEKGLLIIEGRKELRRNPNYVAGSSDWKKKRENIEYTAASLNTSHKQLWQYGRFVMRGRINISEGLWPAWWTLGASGRWPANGEIDIMEYYRKKLLANVACASANRSAEWHSKTKNIDSLGGKEWASRFHVWRMDWDNVAISLYVDDTLLNSVPLAALDNKDGSGANPFKQPHYMLLNLAIGGMNGGDPASTAFPNRFEVDYVRVYQKTILPVQ